MTMKVSIGGRQQGKGLEQARFAAAELRRGAVVFLVRPSETGVVFERIVGVPGFPDGKQLPDG